MAAVTSGAVSKMQAFIDNCTPGQIGELMQALEEKVDKNGAAGGRNAASTMTAKAGVAAKRTGKKARNKKAKLDAATGGPKRPLNSWMAFRKYYNGSLAPNTQKTISKVLTIMWRADPFEAKWAMLAKAYSVVRGAREKEDAPLDKFLALCAPLIGIIPPQEYRQVMGWELTPPNPDDKEKVPVLVRIFVPSFSQDVTTTTLSVDDLVQNCHAAGIIKDGGEETVTHNTSGSLTMAVQPTTTMTDEMMGLVQADEGLVTDATEQTTAAEVLSPSVAALDNAMREAISVGTTGAISLADAAVTLNDFGSQWPHNVAFDPLSQLDVRFDPNEGDAWDAQDIAADAVGEFNFDEFISYGNSS